ncbi:unnamed protein product [Ectocarpus sp. 4 AP-2014]
MFVEQTGMGGGGGGMERSALLIGSPSLSWPQQHQHQHQQPALDLLRTEQQLLADSPVLAGVPGLGLDRGQHLDGVGQDRDGGYGGSFSTGMAATLSGMDVTGAHGMTVLGGVGSDGGVSVPPQQVLVGCVGQGEAAGSRQPQPQPPQAAPLFFQQQHLQHLDNPLTDAQHQHQPQQQQQQRQQPRLATQVSTPEFRNISVTVPFDGSIDGSEGGGCSGSGGGGGGGGREAGSFGRVATL